MASKSTPLRAKSSTVPAVAHADVLAKNPAVQRGWASELKERILLYAEKKEDDAEKNEDDAEKDEDDAEKDEDDAYKFIDKLLPCSVPYPDNQDVATLKAAFDDYNPVAGQEVSSYPSLIAGMRSLVSTFPPQKRLDIVDTSGSNLYFPFNSFKKHHQYTQPDISLSFPGETVTRGDWQTISMAIEVKGDDKQDPFVKDDNASTHVRTVEQLAKNARNLLLAHGFLSAFVVGIYGRTVRLARFDHAYGVVARPFSLDDDDGARVLQKFLWHFVHPVVGHRVVGSDPTVMPFTDDDREWVKTQLSALKPRNWEAHVGELEKGRRVEVYDQRTGRCVPYLAYHLVDVNGRLFSRATMVWRAIEDTRVWKDGKLVPDPNSARQVQPRILKEAWRQLVRRAETEFYDRLESTIPEEDMFGLARMECGGDIGSLELRWWKRRDSAIPPIIPPAAQPADLPVPFCSTGRDNALANHFLAPTVDHVPPFAFPLPYPQHQTYSSRIKDSKRIHCERSHVRIVIADVGHPLTEFKSSREMVAAMRDAIEGHRIAWERANVLHRDVSLGNILIADDAPDGSHRGFLHDWDYSSMGPIDADSQGNAASLMEDDEEISPENIEEHKERTGTYYFMAIALLELDPDIKHQPHHDLESAYWVLVWVVLRHTLCQRDGGPDGEDLCKMLFGVYEDHLSTGQKANWLRNKKEIIVLHNKPLTTLINRFNDLVGLSQTSKFDPVPRVELTHMVVLAAFDEALAMDGWPEDDWKACTLLEKPRTNVPPKPIVADALRSKTASKKALTAGLPTVPSGSASGSHAQPQRSGTKRANEDDEPAPSGATHSRKRSKASAMAPPPAPGSGSGNAVAGPSGTTTSGGRGQRSGSRAAPTLSRQPSRRSSRIEAQKEKKASGSDSAR
ncbi:hypothetical protein PYCCODRAFT_1398059 [Trametes coccinea BRFM310]|uniref:Fungal-type protein kinase domain-containing protein n=1 Tax=Trametes coccinea (strain BRFM310) TaxID=1353009 RepID=A0A1Y2I9R4_TRAC3|nr:hypothetical protein PYCCODRAFT_1398059 [Trametes coccinea BRFM310]